MPPLIASAGFASTGAPGRASPLENSRVERSSRIAQMTAIFQQQAPRNQQEPRHARDPREAKATSPEPTIVPAVPPAAMNPKRRLPCSLRKRSAMKVQNTDTANRTKHAHPDEKDLRDQRALVSAPQQRPEQDEVERKEVIDPRDETRARQFRRRP